MLDLRELILSPFIEFEFMRNALLAILFLSLGGAPLGHYLHFKRLSLAGDAIGHGILPGLAIAFFLSGFSIPAMVIGGFFSSLILLAAVYFLHKFLRFSEDVLLSFLYLVSLSFGILLLSFNKTKIDLSHILFGSALSVDNIGLFIICLFSVISFLLMFIFRKKIFYIFFDYDFAFLMGFKIRKLELLFFLLLALQIVIGFAVLGSLLSVAMIVVPALIAQMISKKFDTYYLLSVFIGAITGAIGLLGSFHFEVPLGPAIILILTGLFICVFFICSAKKRIH